MPKITVYQKPHVHDLPPGLQRVLLWRRCFDGHARDGRSKIHLWHWSVVQFNQQQVFFKMKPTRHEDCW